jgi:hypothetical protein
MCRSHTSLSRQFFEFFGTIDLSVMSSIRDRKIYLATIDRELVLI